MENKYIAATYAIKHSKLLHAKEREKKAKNDLRN